MTKQKVVIIGGGFGGINVAKKLGKADDVEVLMIDRTNHHVFQPLLYQVASAALSPGDVAVPIREILYKQENTTVVMANIESIDKEKRLITASNGETFPYDQLIVAVGAKQSYFGHDEWAVHAPGLKSITDAIYIREKILLSFEQAERIGDMEKAKKYLRFVIIGGGPTGVEMAGAIAEIAHKTMFSNFRRIKPEHSEIYLIEGHPRLLPPYTPRLSEVARQDLEKMGVKMILGTHVTNVTSEGVYIGDQFLETTNIIWAAGNHAPAMLKTLDVPLDHGGRVIVGHDLTIPEHPEIFVIGDAAHALDEEENPFPGLAPVAVQQGRYVAKIIKERTPPEERKPFHYSDKGSMATIGTAKAVGMIGKKQFSGFLAWMAWGVVHIFYLISFCNRVKVMLQWFFWYLTGKRHVRLIKPPITAGKGETITDSGIPSSLFASKVAK